MEDIRTCDAILFGSCNCNWIFSRRLTTILLLLLTTSTTSSTAAAAMTTSSAATVGAGADAVERGGGFILLWTLNCL